MSIHCYGGLNYKQRFRKIYRCEICEKIFDNLADRKYHNYSDTL